MRTLPLIIALGWLGCEPASPSHQASQDATPPGLGAAAPDAETSPEKPQVYEGEGPVQYTAPVVLLEAEGLVVDTQLWRTETSSGRAWRARSARAEVVARDDLGGLEVFEPEPDGPWAIVNGGFYESDPDGDYRPMGVVIADGRSLSPYRRRGGSGVLSVDAKGKASLVHRPDWPKVAKTSPPRHALQSIDRVVVGGESVVSAGKDARGAARSAVAIGDDSVWLVISAADSSTSETGTSSWRLSGTSHGMTLWEWSRFLIETTGAPHALNLDGGVSTQLIAHADGARVEVRGERGTLNAVVVRP